MIYLPLFILFFTILPGQQKFQKLILMKIRKRNDANVMTMEAIIEGKIMAVNENWIELETKKGKELINSDFVQNIKVL